MAMLANIGILGVLFFCFMWVKELLLELAEHRQKYPIFDTLMLFVLCLLFVYGTIHIAFRLGLPIR